MRFSWVSPETAARVKAALREGRASWEEVFAADDAVCAGEPPDGFEPDEWPRLAEHVARAERVLEMARSRGVAAAERRFGGSPHAVERAALIATYQRGLQDADATVIEGVLTCDLDEFVAYGQYLSRLVELRAKVDPAGTVAAFERFVAAAEALATDLPSWPERVNVARDGLASLYVRVGRAEDAEALFLVRFEEEPEDTTVAIGAARAFLEAGDTARAVHWLTRGAERAATVGRPDLAKRLDAKVAALRARMN